MHRSDINEIHHSNILLKSICYIHIDVLGAFKTLWGGKKISFLHASSATDRLTEEAACDAGNETNSAAMAFCNTYFIAIDPGNDIADYQPPNINFDNKGIPVFDLNQDAVLSNITSQTRCCALCLADPRCIAWIQTALRGCFFKKGQAASVPSVIKPCTGCIAGGWASNQAFQIRRLVLALNCVWKGKSDVSTASMALQLNGAIISRILVITLISISFGKCRYLKSTASPAPAASPSLTPQATPSDSSSCDCAIAGSVAG